MIIMFIVETLIVQNGQTPLQLAKIYNKPKTVQFLESYLQEVRMYIIMYNIVN